jgi:hypothetical protein
MLNKQHENRLAEAIENLDMDNPPEEAGPLGRVALEVLLSAFDQRLDRAPEFLIQHGGWEYRVTRKKCEGC